MEVAGNASSCGGGVGDRRIGGAEDQLGVIYGGHVQAALEAFARHSWHEAYTLLTDAGDGLEADHLEMLAVAANLIGRDQDSVRAWERAHVDHLRAGRRDRAAQCACWAALTLLLRGEVAQAGGWMTRAERIVEELGADVPVAARGMLLIPSAIAAVSSGDAGTAFAIADEIINIVSRSTSRTCSPSVGSLPARPRWSLATSCEACACSTR